MAPVFRRSRRWAGDRSGAGAVEFALVAPFLLFLYIGAVDTTRAIVVSQKVQNATVSVNDLVTQASELTKDNVLKTFKAADAILATPNGSALQLRVTAVEINAAGSAKVAWSVSRGLERYTSGKPYTLPANLRNLRDYTLVVTDSLLDFSPLSEMVIRSKIPLSAQSQGRFRGRKAVACADCTK
ncbi:MULTISPECIES: TadE/TadG family type IV pilus assembly protein [unclassified Aureimonas]|uniref:TadE/TadG family type IV pilus assembly protein n=1 Tax=unclassified Aureimonas TaxID=2615206 RepID=UPI0006F61357|nr:MULTISPECIES: TadE/TadG family type IV pilus assembly protein [unclassified Aureimonas]KQT61231.1 hypothetical protein ASG54_24120 [Aureimonas sp. Leaf460]KQT68680.1 hypothetical protein ASG62_18880 [Aureimonas sp. Leaf427]